MSGVSDLKESARQEAEAFEKVAEILDMRLVVLEHPESLRRREAVWGLRDLHALMVKRSVGIRKLIASY